MSDDHDITNYFATNEAIKKIIARESGLQKLEERPDTGVFTTENWVELFKGKYKTQWRGIILMKGPLEIVAYQQLFWDLKPRTILEIGSNSGGSAIWTADTLKMFGCESHVYSMDINLDLLEPLAREKRDDVTFLQGDANEIEKTFTPEMLKSLPHPWFVSEDAHVNVVGVLDYIDQFTEPGDYVVVEDTNQVTPCDLVDYFEKGFVSATFETAKLTMLKEFVKKHPDRYRVDKLYTDFFGSNNTSNMNGYLKRI